LVIAPHPDDEVIGCGGTIRRHLRAGDPVAIIYLTRGENSVGYPWLSPAEKQAKRVREALASCAVLGVRDSVFLDGVDGKLAEPAVLNELATKVAAEVARRSPKVIYVPHAEDKHPDHGASCRMVLQIARGFLDRGSEPPLPPVVYQYELWSPLAADFAVDVSREMRVKLKAIRCHELALDAFNYVPTMLGLAAYRSGTLLQRKGYAEAFKRVDLATAIGHPYKSSS
jgi:LmbE family N-acetylglucosaminyl deacetylase